MTQCPCGSNQTFAKCCEPVIQGQRKAKTAEELMRSRYAAFATHAVEYIRDTVLPEQRKDVDLEQIRLWSEKSNWLGFEVRSSEQGQAQDDEGMVEFAARYEVDGKPLVHHEFSAFKKQDGAWYFDPKNSTEAPPDPLTVVKTVPRNDPCPCGSGKKYKKCCGAA